VRKALAIAGLAGLFALAACGKEADTSAAADPGAAAPTTEAATTAAATTAAAPDESADPVLGPAGFGAVKLGASPAEATAAGLVVTDTSRGTGQDCPKSATLRLPQFPLVMFSTKLGVSAIEAKGAMHTPEGIKIGSKLTDVKKAYPQLKNPLGDPKFNGENFVTVPGNPKAKYRIFVIIDEVRYLHLILANNNCTI